MERWTRSVVFVLCALPFLWVLYAAIAGGLGPDPAEALMHVTGEWALRLLALTLLMSPLRAWTGWTVLIKLRRMLGLYTFFYACIHFVTFLQFYIGWTAGRLLEELAERPYITLGFTAWLLMLPLAYHDQHTPGRLLTHLFSDVRVIQTQMTALLHKLPANVLGVAMGWRGFGVAPVAW